MNVLVTPSILSADRRKLAEEIRSVEHSADWLQIDVMDGIFVPNKAFPIEEVREIRTSLPLDIHLMVADPAAALQDFLALQPKNITFHAEAVKSIDSRRALIEAIHRGGATAGIALDPSTPLSEAENILQEVDLVLVMTVVPGAGGQMFLPETLAKVRTLRARFPTLMIQVDGGINPATAKQCIEAGATNLVAGTSIFGSDDREAAIFELRNV
ncbi:ribulose-phosphate 3-epimerase [Candidatus Peregrinibacteria bacterium]|nr:ribulose-phosphate 3-epimerase [Candidatus Peregrinibacteria bacterium]